MSIFEDEEEEELQYGKRKLPWFYIIYFGVFTVFIVVFKGRLGYSTYDNAMLYFLAGVISVVVVKGADAMWANASPKVVWNPGHDTYLPAKIMTIGNFRMVRLGGRYAWGMHYSGRKATLIAPVNWWEKLGQSLITKARIEIKEFNSLPVMIQNAIVQYNFPPPFLMGYADEEKYAEMIENPDKTDKESPQISVGYLIKEYEDQNKYVTFLINYLKRLGFTVEDIVSQAQRIGAVKGDAFKEFVRKVTGEPT